MLMELNATRYKGKLSQKNRDYKIRNKLYFYYGKSGY